MAVRTVSDCHAAEGKIEQTSWFFGFEHVHIMSVSTTVEEYVSCPE
jgi:hypothetical protein